MAIEIGSGITIGGGITIEAVAAPPASGLQIRNLVYLLTNDSGSVQVFRGWAYKNNNAGVSATSTIQIKWYDGISANTYDGNFYFGTNPWTSIYGSANAASNTWAAPSADITGYSGLVLSVLGIQFFSDYNYAGDPAIMPTFGSETGSSTLLRYGPSGVTTNGLELTAASNSTGNDGFDAAFGYTVGDWMAVEYTLDNGGLATEMNSFNWP